MTDAISPRSSSCSASRSPAMRWSINCAHARCRRDPLWAASCNRTVKVASAGSGSGLVGRVLRGMGLGPSPVSERPILAATHSKARMRRVVGRRATNAPHIWTNFSRVNQRAGFPQHNSASVSIATICVSGYLEGGTHVESANRRGLRRHRNPDADS